MDTAGAGCRFNYKDGLVSGRVSEHHSSQQSHVRAILIGQRAEELLCSSECSGEVLAAVSHAVYLSTDDGEILWLAWAGAPAHRRCILAPFPIRRPEPGMGFTAAGGRLRIGAAMINLTNADTWVPHALAPGLLPSLGADDGRFSKSMAAIQRFPGLRGFGRVLGLVARPDKSSLYSGAPPSEIALLNRAEPVVCDIIAACRVQNMSQIVRAGLELVGLGPGLTPSGDDFLGGLLFVAHHLKRAYPDVFVWNEEPIRDFLNEARLLTNRIGHVVLSDLAHGHGPAPLHDVASSLLNRETQQQLLCNVRRLTRIGHTSGWDMLAGALIGMLLVDVGTYSRL